MDYHIFKKPTKSGNKIVHRWYYYYQDPITGKKIQKVCKGCKNQAQAFEFISSLPSLYQGNEPVVISQIARFMYVPGSDHVTRLEKLGKKLDIKTLKEKRFKLKLFIEEFGELELKDLTIPMVINYLIPIERSGSWKNNFLTVVSNVYDEAPFFGINNLIKPTFPKFTRHTKKGDIFTTEELNKFFDHNVWIRLEQKMFARQAIKPNEDYSAIYLLFFCCISCGLRLGEAIGLRVGQFLFSEGMLVVDGFIKDFERIRTNYNKKGSDEDSKIRVVPVPDILINMIQVYIAEHSLTENDFVFSRYGIPNG